jgi:transposase
VHALVNSRGRPLRLLVTGGHVHDCKPAPQLLAWHGRVRDVLGDKAYDSRAIRKLLRARGTRPVIPARTCSPRNPDFRKRLYRKRNVIERFFARLKDWRRLATRFEKLAANFLAFLHLAAIRIWLAN